MLSDEEKKAIKGLFHLAHINTYLDLEKEDVVKISRTLIDQWRDKTEILLNLIEKQSKEIEELKNADLTTVYISGVYDGEKKVEDKIKAKIEEIDKEYSNKVLSNEKMSLDFININTQRHNAMKLVLEELLEKE